jgi:hypothetical protein
MDDLPPRHISSRFNEDHPMIRSSTSEDHAASPFSEHPEHARGIRAASGNRSPDPSQPPSRQQIVLSSWTWELAAISLSAMAFLAIVVTIYPHDGKPLPQWPYSISINALVSMYVLVLKAAIFSVIAEALSQLKLDLVQQDACAQGSRQLRSSHSRRPKRDLGLALAPQSP